MFLVIVNYLDRKNITDLTPALSTGEGGITHSGPRRGEMFQKKYFYVSLLIVNVLRVKKVTKMLQKGITALHFCFW